jgi:tetratricopeptide (TPR) repeat protein
MKKLATIALIFAGILLSLTGYGQKKESYRSLKSRSSVTNTSSLIKEADALKDNNPAEALNRVQDALALSLAQNDEFNQAKCYLLLGQINENIQEWSLALENYTHAYQLMSVSSATSAEFKKAAKGVGSTHLRLGNYDDALRYYQEALLLDSSELEKAETQLNISEVYYQQGDYDNSLKTLEEINFRSKLSNTSLESRLQNQKAKVYARINNLDKTQDLFQNSLNSARANKKPDAQQKQSIQETKEEIADVLQSQKKYDDEIDLRNQAIEYNIESNNFAEVTKDKVAIGKTLSNKGENAAALKELEEAAKIADTLNNPKEQANAFLALANQYEKNGRNKEALSAYKKYSQAVVKNEEQNETKTSAKSELIKKQKDIQEFTNDVSLGQREETIEQQTVFRQRLIIYGLLLIIAIIALTSYSIYNSAQSSKLANRLLALKSLRSQMNPHFIFNALNSVNHFITKQDERTANKFLSEFSQLMRLVLENSQRDFISLDTETEILSLYLKLEHYRFRDKFDYEIEIDKNIQPETIEVPPMLIQPYIENAVWHGLRYKEEKGKLLLNIRKEDKHLVVEITDDGIGRKKSTQLKTANQKKHNSTGLKNIEERLAIINKVYQANYRISIEDLQQDTGTRVRIYLPISNKLNGV